MQSLVAHAAKIAHMDPSDSLSVAAQVVNSGLHVSRNQYERKKNENYGLMTKRGYQGLIFFSFSTKSK